MKINKLIMTVLAIFLLANTASAYTDDIERYGSGGFAEAWSSTGSSGSYTASVVQFPTSVSTSHSLKTTSSCGSIGTSSAKYTTTSPIFEDYLAFNLRQYQLDSSNVISSTWSVQIQLINSLGNVAGTYTVESGERTSKTVSTPAIYAFVRSGSTVSLYKDEVFVVDLGAMPDSSYYFRVVSNVYCGYSSVSVHQTVNIWIDDITTESIIGVKDTFTELEPTVYYSYIAKVYDSYPDSTFTVDLYGVTNANPGKVTSASRTLTDQAGFLNFSTSTLGEEYGLYLLEMTRGSVILADTYIYYDNLAAPVGLPETLFSAGSNVGMEIRDADNNGGTISSGGSVYLYPDDDSGIYPIRYTLSGAPYSFTANLNAVYGNELINSTPFTFAGLSNTYVATLDGESLSGTKASGTLVISQSATDEETVTIGDDVYEFESSGGVTSGNIQVDIGDNQSVTGANLAEKINSDGVTGVSASSTPGNGIAYYYSNITITDNPEIDDYQASVTITYDDGMNEDFSNIRFFDNETSIPYMIESKTDSTSAVVWIPISEGSDIQCRWGISGETESESDAKSIFNLYDEFDGTTLDTSIWELVTSNTATVSNGYVRLSGGDGNRLISKSTIPDDAIISTQFYIESSVADKYASISVRDQNYQSYIYSKGYLFVYYVGQSSVLFESSGSSITQKDTGDTGAGNTLITRTIITNSTSMSDTNNIVTTDDTYPSGKIGLGGYSGIPVRYYSVSVRKYAATEPTLSVGSVQTYTTSEVASVIVVSDEYGSTSNDIATTETCIHSAWNTPTLVGGSGGSVVDTAIWEYEVTDWTNITNHIFSFSPDLTIPGVYGYVKDVSTQDGIAAVTVTITGTNTSYVYTDENGFYYLTNGMELNKPYTVSAAKSGYEQGATFSITTTAGATSRKDLYLTAEESTSGVYYAVHYVKLVVVDKSWHKLNATMTVSSANETLCTDAALGTDGALSLQMTEDTKYTIQTTYNGLTQTDYITPSDDVYYIIWDATDATLVTEQFYEYINVDISKEITSPSEANINITYTDGKTDTNSVSFILGQYAENGTFITLQTSPTFTANCSTEFTVTDYTGETYVIKASINHGTFGTITKYYSVSFTGSNLPFTGKALAYFAIFILFIVAFQFGKAEHASGAIMLCGVCWLFWYVGIFETFGSTINTTMFAGLSLATIYSLATYINEKRREEGV